MDELEYIDSALPTLCISVYKNNLIFTTKKIGSRYFEDISTDDTDNKNYIDVRLNYLNSNSEIPIEHTFNDIGILLKGENTVDINSFLNKIGVSNFKDIFTKSFIKNYNIIFVVRNPLKRLFSGYIEIVDSIFGGSSNNVFFKYLVERYYNIRFESLDFISLRSNLQSHQTNIILNEFTNLFDSSWFEDEHISYWNLFVYDFIKNTPIYDDISIINLDSIEDMSTFPEFDKSTTNTKSIDSWAYSEDSEVDKLMNKCKVYLSIENNFNKKLLNKRNNL